MTCTWKILNDKSIMWILWIFIMNLPGRINIVNLANKITIVNLSQRFNFLSQPNKIKKVNLSIKINIVNLPWHASMWHGVSELQMSQINKETAHSWNCKSRFAPLPTELGQQIGKLHRFSTLENHTASQMQFRHLDRRFYQFSWKFLELRIERI